MKEFREGLYVRVCVHMYTQLCTGVHVCLYLGMAVRSIAGCCQGPFLVNLQRVVKTVCVPRK